MQASVLSVIDSSACSVVHFLGLLIVLQVAALGGDEAVRAVPLGPIPHPHEQQQQQLPAPAPAAAAAAAPILPALAALQLAATSAAQQEQHAEQAQQAGREEDPNGAAAGAEQGSQVGSTEAAAASAAAGEDALGAWGDGVKRYSEIDAAAGALGRFPGSQVMPLIRQFIGLEAG